MNSMKFLVRVLVNALGLWVATILLPGVEVALAGSWQENWQQNSLSFLVISLIFTLVNMFVRPVVKFFSLPFYLFTIGMFFLVVNGFMLYFTAYCTQRLHLVWNLQVTSFFSACLGAALISLVNVAVNHLLPDDLRTRGHHKS